jgi:amino acid permease
LRAALQVLLVRAGELSETSTYSATAGSCFGSKTAFIVDIFVLLMNFGTAVAYLDVIGDLLCAWTSADSKVGLLFLVATGVILPICLIEDVGKLKFVRTFVCRLTAAVLPSRTTPICVLAADFHCCACF